MVRTAKITVEVTGIPEIVQRITELQDEIQELEIGRDELAAKNRLQAQTLDKVVAERDRLREAITHLPDEWMDFVEDYTGEALSKGTEENNWPEIAAEYKRVLDQEADTK